MFFSKKKVRSNHVIFGWSHFESQVGWRMGPHILPIQKGTKKNSSSWIGKYTVGESEHKNWWFYTKWNPILQGLTCRNHIRAEIWPMCLPQAIGSMYGRWYSIYICIPTLNIYHQRLNLKCIAKAKIYRSSQLYPTYIGSQTPLYKVFFSEGSAEGFVSVSFRSQTAQGTSGRWTDSHGTIEFRTSTGGLLGVDDRCWETGVMEPIGFCHVSNPGPSSKCSLSLSWFPFLGRGSFPFFLKSDFWSVCVSFFGCMCFVCLICLFFGCWFCKSRIWGL